MPTDFDAVFTTLRRVLAKHETRMAVRSDTPWAYTLETKRPSPFPQHEGHGMYFGAVRAGKAYVSFHLMPLYTNEALARQVSPALRKRMQGKSCFNFKTVPERETLAELAKLTAEGIRMWKTKKWV